MPTAQEMTDHLRRAIDAVNTRDMEFLQTLTVSDDFVRHDMARAFEAPNAGKAEVKSFLGLLWSAFPDVFFHIQDVMPSGDEKLVVRYVITGTHKGELFGIEATGREISMDAVNIYRYSEDVRIAEVWQIWDWTGVLKTIGAFEGSKLKLG